MISTVMPFSVSVQQPDIAAFDPADFIFFANALRNPDRALIEAAQVLAGFSAWSVIRIACDDHAALPAPKHLLPDEPAGAQREMMAAPGRIDMITDMPEIENTGAFPVPIAELPDLPSAAFESDAPDSLRAKAQPGIRPGRRKANEADLIIRKLRGKRVKKKPRHTS